MNRQAGFSVTELLLATAIMSAITAVTLGLARVAEATFHAQVEAADMQQRLRVAIARLTQDLIMAGAGLAVSDAPAVMPYRAGDIDSDASRGVFYRPDAITVLYVPTGQTDVASHTYYLNRNVDAGEFHLMHYDGRETDLPVVDHVVTLRFEYFGAEGIPLSSASLEDGPWMPDPSDPSAFDADLLQICRIRVSLRVQASRDSMRGLSGTLFTHGGGSTASQRYLPDQEIQIDVSPRNLIS